MQQYIANRDPAATYGADCKHGDREVLHVFLLMEPFLLNLYRLKQCYENIVQLCVQDSYPDPKKWFEFILCQNEDLYSMPSELHIRTCSNRLGIDYDMVKQCVKGPRGRELFLESVQKKDEARVM
jgi:hypothetical protein